MSNKFEHQYVETTVENWNDLFLLNQRFTSHFIFRGQANSEWGLTTSLERLIEKLHPQYSDWLCPLFYEQEMIDEFTWKYPIYEKITIPQKEEYIEWLSIMQHYGAPTRMLDFSYSLFVALFMAIDNSFYENSSIWAINKEILRAESFSGYRKKYNTCYAGSKNLDNYIYECANRLISNHLFREKPINKDLFVVRPHHCNERINRQQGLFVIPSNICISFKENLQPLLANEEPLNYSISKLIEYANSSHGISSQNDITLLKIIIPRSLKYGITNSLKQMNITSETMYPGIEGLAKSLSCLRNSMGGYKE